MKRSGPALRRRWLRKRAGGGPRRGSAYSLVRRLWVQRPALLGIALGLGLLTTGTQLARLGSVYLLVSTPLGGGPEDAGGGLLARTRDLLRWLPIDDPFLASVALFVGLETAFFLFRYVQDVFAQYASLRLREDFNLRLFDKFAASDYQEVLSRRQGDLLYRIVSAPALLGAAFVAVPEFIILLLETVLVVGVLLVVSVPATLALMVIACLFLLVNEFLGRLVAYDWADAKIRLRERQSRLVKEALDGIRQIKLYGHVSRWTEAFRETCDGLAVLVQKLFAMSAVPKTAVTVGTVAVLVMVAGVLKLSLGERFVTYLPVIAVYLVGMRRVLGAAGRLAQARLRIVENLPVAQLVFDELDEPPAPRREGARAFESLGDGIAFENVSLSFPEKPGVLRDVSFVCKTGEVTAIVGPSGGGKSSLLNLVVRLHQPARGVIRAGGVDIADLDVEAWRQRIGFVAQESFLFHASVAQNIAFGRCVTRAEVEEAARLAGADEFILALPDGYDTIVGERGLKLSGGERQRIGIARAILKSPGILMFDEATSSLDSHSEAVVQAAIDRLSPGRTVILVAHRLATVQNADSIVVLGGGRVVENGTHASLLDARGLYYALYHRQRVREHGTDATAALAR